MSFTETLDAMRGLSSKWPQTTRKLVEDKANGTAVIDVLKKEIPGIIPVEPFGGKVVRAMRPPLWLKLGTSTSQRHLPAHG